MYSFVDMCRELGKPPVYVRGLQQALGLAVPKRQRAASASWKEGKGTPAKAKNWIDGEGDYAEAYSKFLQKVVALRTFNIQMPTICELFSKERKILELLHFDTISDSPTWYLDACAEGAHSDRHLLLTGHDLGFPLAARAIQSNLDFAERSKELFEGPEMGEDVRRILESYLVLLQDVRERIHMEKRVLLNALMWSEQAF